MTIWIWLHLTTINLCPYLRAPTVFKEHLILCFFERAPPSGAFISIYISDPTKGRVGPRGGKDPALGTILGKPATSQDWLKRVASRQPMQYLPIRANFGLNCLGVCENTPHMERSPEMPEGNEFMIYLCFRKTKCQPPGPSIQLPSVSLHSFPIILLRNGYGFSSLSPAILRHV